MSFNQIKRQLTPLEALGWYLYPIDDGQVRYSYDEMYLFMYLQHSLNRSHDMMALSTHPVAIWVNEDEWYFPNMDFLHEIGVADKQLTSRLTCTNEEAHQIFNNIFKQTLSQMPVQYTQYAEHFSIFIWLNGMKYSDAIPKLLLHGEENNKLHSRENISNKIIILNYLKYESQNNNLCEQLLAYEGLNEYFLKALTGGNSLNKHTVKNIVNEYNRLAGY